MLPPLARGTPCNFSRAEPTTGGNKSKIPHLTGAVGTGSDLAAPANAAAGIQAQHTTVGHNSNYHWYYHAP